MLLVNKDYKHGEHLRLRWRGELAAQRALIFFMFIAAKSMFYTSSIKSEKNIYGWVDVVLSGRYYVTRLLIASRRALQRASPRIISELDALHYLSHAGISCTKHKTLVHFEGGGEWMEELFNILFGAITLYVTCKILLKYLIMPRRRSWWHNSCEIQT